MTDVVVRPVQNRRQRKAFLELPWKLYQNDPNWIPPLLLNQRELLGYKRHPFHDDAQVQTFLAYRQGDVVGRIAAVENRAHNRRYKEQRGFWGFFESVEDQQVADALFNAARNWLADRDIHLMRGPVNPSLNYEVGLLVDGFDTPPFFMMTHNLPYYERLVEGYGFATVQDIYAYYGDVARYEHLDKKLWFICQESKERFGLKIRPMDRSRFMEEVQLFLRIYNESLQRTWGFVPLSEGEIHHLAKGLRQLIEPELALVCEIEGKPIGAVFGLLDYNVRIKQINGRLFPFGFLKLLMNRRAIKRMRVISANVLPEYQMMGVGLVLLDGLVPKIKEWGMEEVEFSWVLESNHLSRRSLERGGAELTKTYRLYDWPASPQA